MKNHNNELDIFNDADDETIEWLSKHNQSLSDKELKRIFAMSEKKYNKRKKQLFFSSDNSEINKVTGVENYSRPKYFKTLLAASAFLITASTAVTGIIWINKLNDNPVTPNHNPYQYYASNTTSSHTTGTYLTNYETTYINTTIQTTVSGNHTSMITTVFNNADIDISVPVSVPESSTNEINDTAPITSDTYNNNQTNTTESIPPVSSDVTDNNQEKIEEYRKYADQLLIELNNIEKIGGGNVQFDMDDSFTDRSGNTFARVTEMPFSNTDELNNYIKSNITDTFFNERYSNISSRYIDVDGKLYGEVAPTGSGFNWLDTERDIIDITDNSFKVLAEFEWYGSNKLMTIEITLENGKWKVNFFSSI